MSWLSGYKAKPSTSDEATKEDAREAKRKKLEADRKERHQRSQLREQTKRQLLAAQLAREEADKALQDLLDIAPDIFSGTTEEVSEDILNDSNDITMADFETENGTDGDKAMDKLGTVKCEFSKDDIEFWFSELESQLEVIEIRNQWTKRIALQRFLPAEIKQEIKTLLKLTKAQAGNDIYKKIKAKLINLYGPKPEEAYLRAKNRVMTGKPSQLGEALIDDICECETKLAAGCCAKIVWGMYRDAIPVVVRNHIAQLSFNKDTYQQIFTISDQVFDSNQAPDRRPAVAAVETQQANPPEVAAASTSSARRGGGSNRGWGGRGGGRGGGARPNTNSNSNTNTNSNTNSNANTNSNTNNASNGHKGPRHATAKGSNDKLCKIHYRWGENGSYCAAPWKCPMKDVYRSPQ